MTENENTGRKTPEETSEEDARTGQPTNTPRGNGPVDEEALEKGKENIESVKPY
jgi:hypothetical protein